MGRSKRKSSSGSKFGSFRILSFLFMLVSGGGTGAYFNPDWPVVGPLVRDLVASVVAERGGDPGALREAIAERSGRESMPAAIGGGGAKLQVALPRERDKLLVASFNIQVLGRSKLAKPDVVDVLAQTLRQFDVVAIQEVRAKDDNVLPQLVAAVNADGSKYDFVIGPRLGRSVSTEQYAFVFDTTRVEYERGSAGTFSDPNDLMHREPFAARFRAAPQGREQPFSFLLVNIHTDPDEVKEEVDALADVFQVMQSAISDEDDVILLGDLNASEYQLGRLGAIPGITWAVRGAMTNTRKTKAYDNLLFHEGATSEYTGRWGVLDLEQSFGLTQKEALRVSDHLPVWAEFDVRESTGRNIAGRLRIRR